jgi:hypothetical protein
MAKRSRLFCAAVWLVAGLPGVVSAQWLNYPTSDVPRTADGQPDLAAAAPRTTDGKPDLSGMWGWDTPAKCGAHCNDFQIPREFINIAASRPGTLPYQPGVDELVKRRSSSQDEDPNVHCMPRGAPRIWTDDYYKRLVQTRDRLIILTERNMQYRQIFIDGRPLPVDPNPTWNGYSTAKWDGDTLVVQTIGFKDGLWLDAHGNPLGSAARLTERIRRPNYGTLEVEMTIDDPTSYTEAWTVRLTQPLVLDSELLDYYCLENEKSWAHMKSQESRER